jgi:sec-independent protein translocase protein TatB
MFNVGTGELVLIMVLALIVLGPDKLPTAARQAGRYLAEFRRISNGFQQEFRDAVDSAMIDPVREGADTFSSLTSSLSDTFRLTGRDVQVAPADELSLHPPGDQDLDRPRVALDKPDPIGAADGFTEPEPGPPAPSTPVEVDGPSGSFS